MSPEDRQAARQRRIREASIIGSSSIPLTVAGRAIGGSRGLAVAVLVFLAILAGWACTRTQFRYIVPFSWRLRARYAYRQAGSKDWMISALLSAAGVTPADVQALIGRGSEQHHLSYLGDVLTDDLDRSARLAVDAILTSQQPIVQIMMAIEDLLDLDADPQEILAFLSEDIDPERVVGLIRAQVPYPLAQQVARLASPLTLDRLAGLWPRLATHGYPPQAMINWLSVDVNAIKGEPLRVADHLLTWHEAAGEDAPWWKAAGYTPKEAKVAYAAGTAPSREALAVLAGLRATGR